MNHPPQQRRPVSNCPSLLLTDQENQDLFDLLGRKCVTLATAVVQVYIADDSGRDWKKRCTGVVCFVKDNPMRSYYIRVYSIKKKAKLWEQELYINFKYSAPRPYFHTFDTEFARGGLNFANQDEAQQFKQNVEAKLKAKQEKKQAKRNNTIKRNERPNIPQSGGDRIPLNNRHPPNNNHHQQSPPVTNAPPMKTIDINTRHDDYNVKKKDKKKKGKKGKISKADISSPSGFKHVNHVGWDPNKGFDMNNLDSDVKELFQSAGVTEKDMQDEEKAQFIYDFIEKQGGIDRVKKEREKTLRRQPPPPNRSNAPPPPPRKDVGPPPPPQQRHTQPPPPPNRRQQPPPPPPPGRQPPRNIPPPPPPSNIPPPPPISQPSGGIPPPPPIAVGGAGGPPPPPPLAAVKSSSTPPAATGGGRGALLDQIRQGNKQNLKPAGSNAPKSKPACSSSGGGRNDLLAAIRDAKKDNLRKVDTSKIERPPTPEPAAGGGSLADALSRALKGREKTMQDSDSDSDDEEDDDEWED